MRPTPSLSALLLAAACTSPSGGGPADPVPVAAATGAVYRVYVGAESADLMHRVRFAPGGPAPVATVEKTVPVGELSVETEGPHGFATSPDGRWIYMTTGHGVPDGKVWKYHAGPDTLVAAPILLGFFPATLDLTPDGRWLFAVNFNLHGEHVPSTVSVVYTPDMVEVEQITTCTMPHGLRTAPDGLHAYSACMMDDQLVEIDTRTFDVSRRFSVAEGAEGPMAGSDAPAHAAHAAHGGRAPATCSPTWAEPSPDGDGVYVACNGASRILEVDREGWTLRRTIATSKRGPYNLEVTPDGRRLIATLKPSAAVEVFDLESGRSLGVVPSSTTIPHGVVASPDSRYAFVSVEGVGAEPGKVDVIDLRAVARVASVEVGQQAGGITFWSMEAAR